MTNTYELSKYCWLITQAAEQWLAEQDELTCTIHQVAVGEVQADADASLRFLLSSFRLFYPSMWRAYGRETITIRAAAFLASELAPLSMLLSAFYYEFNVRWFGGSLPAYRVKVMHNVPMPEKPENYTISCVDTCRRELSVVYCGRPADMVAWLLRLMAHVRTGRWGKKAFENELDRLSKMSAPTQDNVERLQEAGWAFYSTAPWFAS